MASHYIRSVEKAMGAVNVIMKNKDSKNLQRDRH